MTLIIVNQTGNARLYLSGAITVPASGSLNVAANLVFSASRDSILVSDCKAGVVILSDGVNTYIVDDAINYLNQIATSIGGAVVGLVGSTAPSFAITVGGKDPNGNTVIGTFDSNSNLKVIDAVNTTSQYQAISVTTSSTEAIGAASRLPGRKLLCITPTNGTIYWATTTGVTTTSGQPIFPNNTLFLSFTDAVPVYIIAGATTDVRVLEAT